MSDINPMPNWRRFHITVDTLYDGLDEAHALTRFAFDVLRRAGWLSNTNEADIKVVEYWKRGSGE